MCFEIWTCWRGHGTTCTGRDVHALTGPAWRARQPRESLERLCSGTRWFDAPSDELARERFESFWGGWRQRQSCELSHEGDCAMRVEQGTLS